jgi:chromosomal replication initiation ATPase DnaA
MTPFSQQQYDALGTIAKVAEANGASWSRAYLTLQRNGVQIQAKKNGRWHLDQIVPVVAEFTSVDQDRLIARGRQHPIVYVRQLVFYIAHVHGGASLPCIAEYFKMDHTTVLHGVRHARDHFDDDLIKRIVAAIEVRSGA